MLSEDHLAYLEGQAISGDLARRVCVTTPEGIGFNFVGPTGRTAQQVRLDRPRDPDAKYIGPAGVASVMPVPPGHEPLVADVSKTLVIVEGSKGILAAASALAGQRHDYALVGLLGCWGWSHQRKPSEDLLALPVRGRDVVVVLDADMADNRAVWESASALQDLLVDVRGARSVSFRSLPGRAKEGTDDILAMSDDPHETFVKLIATASEKLGRRPAAGSSNRFFDNRGGLLLQTTMDFLFAANELAQTAEGTIAVYRDGLYRNGESREWQAVVSRALGEQFREAHYKTINFEALTRTQQMGRVIGARPDRLLINVRNGLLDPMTLELHPHDPEFMSLLRIDVEWDPEALCPTWDSWLEEMLPGQQDALEDALSPMLDPTRTPAQAVFCYGPSNSGKSTVARLMAALVGSENCSSVTLHQLAEDRFASANMYGKLLNIAMDLSSKDVKDLSVFKMLTGEDPVLANRKWGEQFSFTNQALMIFSANDVPKVSETSQAWANRVAPFAFTNSFGERVDESFERKMKSEELPGIFRRLVLALNRRLSRKPGESLRLEAKEDFLRRTNTVAEFLAEKTRPDESGTGRAKVLAAYRVWMEENGNRPLSRNKFYDSMRAQGVEEHKPQGGSWMFKVKVIDPETHDDGPGSAVSSAKSGESADLSHSPLTHSLNENSSQCSKGVDVEKSAENPPKEPSEASLLPFDLETAEAGSLHSCGDGFLRLVQSPGGRIDTGAGWLLSQQGRCLVAHNGFNFDFPALAVHAGMDMLGLSEAGRLYDSKIGALLASPPMSNELPKPSRRYSLNVVAEAVRGRGKADDLKRLAKRFDGFDRIPLGDDEYRAYASADVNALEAILEYMPVDAYAWREMRLMGRLAYAMRVVGWKVDTALLAQKAIEFEARQAAGIEVLRRFGFPDSGAAPHRSNAGRAALEELVAHYGVTDVPRTEKTGAISQRRDDWAGVAIPDGMRPAIEAVWSLNSNRTIHSTVDAARVGDRVYPSVMPYQATGRFSITPGLTVVGKRGGRHHERAMYLPDDGELLVAFDLNQIDARAIAMHSQDAAYMQLFIDPEIDSHRWVAKRLWGNDDDAHRNRAKAIAHGWNYGESLRRISEDSGLDMSVVERFDTGMREEFPRLIQWRDEVREEARSGALLDNGMGRKVKVNPDRAHTQAPAFMGQSLARDLLCEGVLRLPVELVPNIRGLVHDELVLSVPRGDVEDVKAAVLDALQFEYMGVPVTAGFEGSGSSWAEIYGGK